MTWPPSWWIDPVIPPERWWQFGVTLGVLTLLTVLFSPHRRRALGVIKLALAHASLIGIPLLGVIVVRSGFRHAYVDAGRNFWDSMWLSFLWMTAFIFIGEFVVTRVPPTSWLIRDLRRAGKDMWMGRLRRFLGVRR